MGIIVSLVLGAMCGMGIGSAGLFVTYLVIVCGVPQLPAQGANLIFFLASGGAAMTVHLRRRRIPPDRFIRIAVPAAVMSVVGSLIAPHIPAAALRPAFGVLLICAGINSALRTGKTVLRRVREKRTERDGPNDP